MTSQSVEKRVQTVCLLILSTVAIAFSLYWLRNVLIPVVLAFFLTILLNPVVSVLMKRCRMSRGVAVVGSVALGFAAMLLLSFIVSIAVSQFTANIGLYQERIEKLSSDVMSALPLHRFGIDEKKLLNPLAAGPQGGVSELLANVLRSVFSIVSQAVLVLIFLFFLLIGKHPTQPSRSTIWEEIDVRVKRYLIAKTLLSIFAGILVWSILAVLGVPLALTFGLLVFLLNFVPNIGSIIATLLPIPIVLVNPDISLPVAILAIALPAAAQFILGSFIEPRVLGNSLDLHPATILLALIFWGTMWGIVGMLLAAPITAIMRILLEKLEITAPIARVMAGRLHEAPSVMKT